MLQKNYQLKVAYMLGLDDDDDDDGGGGGGDGMNG